MEPHINLLQLSIDSADTDARNRSLFLFSQVSLFLKFKGFLIVDVISAAATVGPFLLSY
jgi:hypothetical protein